MIPNITVPTLIVDEQKVRRNIDRMLQRARRHHLPLRPHFKTHQSDQIGQWFREGGVNTITVSSLRMAEYFAEAGWDDITNAFPVNILEMDRIQRLAQSVKLNLLVENPEAIRALDSHLTHEVGIFIKINSGNNRTGLLPENTTAIDTLLALLAEAPNLTFKGFLAHAGHTYQARGKEEIARIHYETMRRLEPLISHYRERYPDLIFSYGDTPSCSTMEDFGMANELRPGNFVFYDLTQATIGSCTLDDIAVAMACPVVAKHPERNDVVVYGGGIHFSKDQLVRHGEVTYGLPVRWTREGWDVIDDGRSHMRKLSQEHGILHVSDELFADIQIGEIVGVVPVHSCMTADLMKAYQTLEGRELGMLKYV